MNLQLYIFITHADCSTFTIMKLLSSICYLHCARFMKTAVLMMWQTHVLLLWQQHCQLSSHLAQGALCESFSFGHVKYQLKPIPVSVTALVLSLPWLQKIGICLLWYVCISLQPQKQSTDLHWSHRSGHCTATQQVTGRAEVSSKLSVLLPERKTIAQHA